jgi:hypothetical protein
MHFTRFSIFTIDLEETDLRTGPRISQISPQDANLLQLGPWRHGQRRELDSGEGKARIGRERAGECSGTHLRPIPGVGRLRGRAGEGARRHHALAAAATGLPANRSLSLEHKRLGEL